MQIDKKADFVLKGNKVVYPEIAKDGLELYYDTKGKKNTDTYKNKLLDMSGNDRHGELHNFSYKNLSGYQEDSELVFDGIDDTLTMPKLSDINKNSFTYQLNNNILAFTGDEFKTVKNGDVEVGGKNYWAIVKEPWHSYLAYQGDGIFTNTTTTSSFAIFRMDKLGVPVGETYTASFEIKVSDDSIQFNNDNFYVNGTSPSTKHNRPTLVKNKWVRVYATLNYTVENTRLVHIYIGGIPAINTFQIRNFQLEKGSTSTDWIPAPEDLIETTDLKGNILGDVEDIVDASPRDRQSGKEVFTEHADNSHVEVEVDGQSYQHAGKGGDLIKESDLIYAWVGTRNVTNNIGAFVFTSAPYSPATYQIEARAVDDNLVGAEFGWQWSSAIRGESVTLSKEWKKASAYFDRGSNAIGLRVLGGTGLIELRHIKAEEGTTATPYIPEPTPDYPIEIHSLNDFDVVSQKSEGGTIDGVEVGGRNLLIQSKFLQNRVVQTHSGDIISVNKGNTIGGFIPLKNNKLVTVSRKNGTTNEYGTEHLDHFKVSAYNENFEAISVQDSGNASTQTILPPKTYDIPEGTSYLLFSSSRGDLYNLKVEFGNKATNWTPAPEDIAENDNHPLIDKINLSLSEPLRSAGDAKDRIYKDGDGLWKIERNIGKYVADGTENWRHWEEYSNGHRYDMTTTIPYAASGNIENALNTHLVSDGEINNTDGVHRTWNYSISPRVVHFGVDSVDELVKWIKHHYNSGTPVTWIYELATPTIETLDQELQGQLNTLKSFKGSNYVYTVQNKDSPHKEQLKPTLHAIFNSKDYLKETRTLTNLLIWARELSDEELIHHNQLFLNRFNLPSDRVIGEPIEQTLNILHGGMVGHSLEQNYTINI